jgi:SAM-dependent methyltransferase
MDKHITELLRLVPTLLTDKVLDLGAGRGRFLIALTKRGGNGVGLELNPAYIKEAQGLASEAGVRVVITEGVGEKLPFGNSEFTFANLSEVLEHVENPVKVLEELNRVLIKGGKAYVSIPNRFGFKDPHYHLYGINWMPRAWSEMVIRFLERGKNEGGEAGRQKLSEMHYTTYNEAKTLFKGVGFMAIDIREKKIKEKYKNLLIRSILLMFYKILRTVYFDTFHFLVTRM